MINETTQGVGILLHAPSGLGNDDQKLYSHQLFPDCTWFRMTFYYNIRGGELWTLMTLTLYDHKSNPDLSAGGLIARNENENEKTWIATV